MKKIIAELLALSPSTWLFLLVILALVTFVGSYFALWHWAPPQPTPLPPQPDAISGIVYCDVAANGRVNEADTGVQKVAVELWQNGSIVMTDTTRTTSWPPLPNYAGSFRFTGLAAATYEVRVVETGLPAALLPAIRTEPAPGLAWPTVNKVDNVGLVAPYIGYKPNGAACP